LEKVNSLDSTPEEVETNVKYTNYNMTMSAYIEAQKSANPKSYSTSYFEQYINPEKCNKYEFLEINKFREINVDTLNALLEKNNAGVLKGQGQAISDAAKKYSIDPLYFISQSIHETGYGKSTLAKGVTITEIADENYPIKDSNGNITGYKMIQLDEPVTVYNLYGIGAKDNLSTMPNRALVLGTTKAYNEGWTSIEKAIEGAAKFISDGYINNTKYNQNTIYKMRYNPNKTYIWHQYATSPWYSRDISALMEKFDSIYAENVTLTYDKPKFN
jgi:beta-N-acetylglucosaminidase